MKDELLEKTTPPRVVAVVGAIAAGKDELAGYLVEHHDAAVVEVGEFARSLREVIDEEGVDVQYDRWISDLGDYGSAYILQRLVDEIVENGGQTPKTLIITGVRTPAEAAFLKAHFGSDILLVFVKVGDRKLRYERLQTRQYETDPDHFKGFVELDEQMKGDHALEETADWADLILWNNGSLEDYHQRIETEVMPYLKRKDR